MAGTTTRDRVVGRRTALLEQCRAVKKACKLLLQPLKGRRSLSLLEAPQYKSLDEMMLPEQRESTLTPCPSREHRIYECAAKTSAFFRLLPLEIRQHVYLQAFGGRIVWMGLEPINQSPDVGYDWCVLFDLDPPGSHYYNCTNETAEDDVNLGILGWLTSCRQAYTEGIDFFFSSNTFELECPLTLNYSHQLFLPQRLANIKALELTWSVSFNYRPSEATLYWENHYALLNRLCPATFPSLQKLNIFLCTSEDREDHPNAQHIKRCESNILDPIGAMVNKFGPGLQDCQIYFIRHVFLTLLDSAKTRSNGVIRLESGGQGDWSWSRFRRSTALEEHVKGGHDEDNQHGYWIKGLSSKIFPRHPY